MLVNSSLRVSPHHSSAHTSKLPHRYIHIYPIIRTEASSASAWPEAAQVCSSRVTLPSLHASCGRRLAKPRRSVFRPCMRTCPRSAARAGERLFTGLSVGIWRYPMLFPIWRCLALQQRGTFAPIRIRKFTSCLISAGLRSWVYTLPAEPAALLCSHLQALIYKPLSSRVINLQTSVITLQRCIRRSRSCS